MDSASAWHAAIVAGGGVMIGQFLRKILKAQPPKAGQTPTTPTDRMPPKIPAQRP